MSQEKKDITKHTQHFVKSTLEPAPTHIACPFSFEFFPPKTSEGAQLLLKTQEQLLSFMPSFCSITHGAGGNDHRNSLPIIVNLVETKCLIAPHVACVGKHPHEIKKLLEVYKEKGIKRLVIIRGDLPSQASVPVAQHIDASQKTSTFETSNSTTPASLYSEEISALKDKANKEEYSRNEFYYASQLVEFTRKHFGNWFYIYVAAYPEVHPQAKSPKDDLTSLVQKVQAGANSAITQYFYSPDAYYRLRDEAQSAGVDIPILPGIMPIHQYKQLLKFSELCGAEIPRWLKIRLESYADDSESLQAFGIEVVSRLCQSLIKEEAPGLHFYTLNRSNSIQKILENLS